MRNKVLVKFPSCFLFLAIGLLLLFCPFASKAQTSAVNLAGTEWTTGAEIIPTGNIDNSITTLTRYLVFYKQGKVEAAVVRDKGIGSKTELVLELVPESEFNAITGNYETRMVQRQVQKFLNTPPEFNSETWKGTYEIKGKSVYLDFPSCIIEASISGGSLKGVATYKGSKEKEAWILAPLTAKQNNLRDGNTNSGSLREKRLLVVTLFAIGEGLSGQATDLRDKGETSESQKKYREAIDAFSTIIGTELDTKQYVIEAYIERALIKSGLKDYKGAIEDYCSAVQLSTPFKKNVMEILAAVESRRKSTSGDAVVKAGASLTLLEELRKKNPEVSAAIYVLQMGNLFRAIAKSKLGDQTDACAL